MEYFCECMLKYANTVFTWKSAYAGKGTFVELAPPFDVKYLMNGSFFSQKGLPFER